MHQDADIQNYSEGQLHQATAAKHSKTMQCQIDQNCTNQN
jgi:hypothetical protein